MKHMKNVWWHKKEDEIEVTVFSHPSEIAGAILHADLGNGMIFDLEYKNIDAVCDAIKQAKKYFN